MTDQNQEVLLERLKDLKDHVLEQIKLAKETNGRLRKDETAVAVLKVTVFGGGWLLLGVVGWIAAGHIKW